MFATLTIGVIAVVADTSTATTAMASVMRRWRSTAIPVTTSAAMVISTICKGKYRKIKAAGSIGRRSKNRNQATTKADTSSTAANVPRNQARRRRAGDGLVMASS